MIQPTFSEEEENDDDIAMSSWMFDESRGDSTPEWSTTNELSFTNETVVRRIYALAEMLHNALTSSEIRYWACGGTLLGCVRHRGLIPWDDDLDLCIYQKDEGKISSCLKRRLNDNGYEIVDVPTFGYRVFHKTESESLLSEGQGDRYPFCDILVMKRKHQLSSIVTGCGRALWPEEYYNNKDLDQIQPRLFGNVFLNCPANAEEYLRRTYGEHWDTEGSTQNYDHIRKQFVKPVKFKLLPEHYEPAKPFSLLL